MASVLLLLGRYVFSGVPSNAAYDVIKTTWQRASQKTWEQLYLDAFEDAVNDARPRLAKYSADDGAVELDRSALSRVLHQDLSLELDDLSLSALGEPAFAKMLAQEMQDRDVLIIGGNRLSDEDCFQLTLNLVRHATSRFKSSVLANENAFRQALVAEAQGIQAHLTQVQSFLNERFGLLPDKLEIIEAGVLRVEGRVEQMPARIAQMLRDDTFVAAGVTAERDQLRLKLSTERERRLQDRYEQLRDRFNAGYVTSARPHIVELVDEIEDMLASGGQVSQELLGRVYRLSASAFVPGKPGGDIGRCRAFLMKARARSAANEALVQCQILEALMACHSHGLEAALALLAGIECDEVTLLRFSLRLQDDRLAECRQMIEEGEIDTNWAVQKRDWARVLTLYYAADGDREALNRTLEVLTDDRATADELEVAGIALRRLAFARLRGFCRDHSVFPEFHLMLDLDDLVDRAARDSAVSHLVRASDLYEQEDCRIDAVRTLSAALRLRVDNGDDAHTESLSQRLRRLDPDLPVSTWGAVPSSDVGLEAELGRLGELLADSALEPSLILHVARSTAGSPPAALQVAHLLQHHEPLFAGDVTTRVQFEFLVLQLLDEAGLEDEAVAWLGQLSSPEGHTHLRPLRHVGFYLERDSELSAQWLSEAQAIAPEHPEVLAVEVMVYRRQGELDAAASSAKKLFAQLRTAQTTFWLVDALLACERWVEVLEAVDDGDGVALPLHFVHQARVHAWLGQGRPLQAQSSLEWLRDHHKSTPQDLLNLARIYQYVHRVDDTIAVLAGCVQQYPGERDGYLELSQALLDEGRRQESFRWAVAARQRFADDPTVASHLFYLSFASGFEDRPEVREVFGELIPGGRFADAGLLTPKDVSELHEFLRLDHQKVGDLERRYHQGLIPSMWLCHVRNASMLAFHHAGMRSQTRRYAALGNQAYGVQPPRADWPPQVVLDYSALLTLWSLFGDTAFDALAACFEGTLIPASLLGILMWEQRRISSLGQPARYKYQVELRDAVLQQPPKFVIHSPSAVLGTSHRSSTYAEAAIARDLGLVHLNEYSADDGDTESPSTIGLNTVADLLYRAGEINLIDRKALVERAKPARSMEENSRSHATRDSAIVADITTLEEIAAASCLRGVIRYFGRIHIAGQSWQRLLDEVTAFDHRERIAQEMRELRDLLRKGIESGFVRADTITPEQRLMSRLGGEAQGSSPASETPEDTIMRLDLCYVDELLGLAHLSSLPIWTDDRWTCRLNFEELRPAFIFGTDSFLERMRAEGNWEDDDAFAYYGKLIQWGYLGLPIHMDYVSWLLRQGMEPDARALTDALALYRESILQLWNATEGDGGFPKEFSLEVYNSYNRRLVGTLRHCYQDGIDLDVAATVLRELGLGMWATQLEGREPMYLSSLLLKAILAELHDRPSENGRAPDFGRFSKWLSVVALEAGSEPELVQEAWYILVEHALGTLDRAASQLDSQMGRTFVGELLDSMPAHAAKYLLVSPLGDRLREDFGLELVPQRYFELAQPGREPTRLTIRGERWDEAFNRAVEQYLLTRSDQPITVDVVTVQVHSHQPGSMYIGFRESPAKIMEELGTVPAGAPVRYLFALSDLYHEDHQHRLAVWEIGRQKLLEKGLPTDEWMVLRCDIVSGEPATWSQASFNAQRYLLNQWGVAWDYLVEASALGASAIQSLLPCIRPETVEEWLGVPQHHRIAGVAWQTWVQRAEQVLWDPLISHPDPRTALDQIVTRLGHTVFPDSRTLREAIIDSLVQAGDVEEQHAWLHDLVVKACSGSSMSLRANIVLTLLEWRAKVSQAGLETPYTADQEVATLIRQIVLGWGFDDARLATLARLEQQLCHYLYTVCWRDRHSPGFPPERLAYLAHVAAGIMVCAFSENLSRESADRIIDYMEIDARQVQITQQPTGQPEGFFRPIWSPYLNYAACFLLESAMSEGLDLRTIVSDSSVREALLECGASHRVLQSYLDTAEFGQSWLDEYISTDVPSAIALLLAGLAEEGLTSWPEEHQHAWRLCVMREPGQAWVSEAISKIPTVDDDAEVLKLISLVFLGVHSHGSTWQARARQLLTSSHMQRIRRSSQCYAALVWRIGEILLDTGGAMAELRQDAEAIIRELPILEEGVAELVGAKSEVLSKLLTWGLTPGLVADWIETVIMREDLPVSAVRRALLPFVRLWPQYRGGVKSILGRRVVKMSAEPRIAKLWEIRRIVRSVPHDQGHCCCK